MCNILTQKVYNLIKKKKLVNIVSENKWKLLKESISQLPFPPPYVIKGVLEDENSYHEFLEDVDYFGDWSSESFLDKNLFAIEWIKVRPRYIKYQGKLISGKVIDETDEFIEMLNRCEIPFEKNNGVFIIYGYK